MSKEFKKFKYLRNELIKSEGQTTRLVNLETCSTKFSPVATRDIFFLS